MRHIVCDAFAEMVLIFWFGALYNYFARFLPRHVNLLHVWWMLRTWWTIWSTKFKQLTIKLHTLLLRGNDEDAKVIPKKIYISKILDNVTWTNIWCELLDWECIWWNDSLDLQHLHVEILWENSINKLYFKYGLENRLKDKGQLGFIPVISHPNEVSREMAILFNCLRNWNAWGAQLDQILLVSWIRILILLQDR